MKRFILTVAIFGAIFSSLYTWLWFYQSNNVQSIATESLRNLAKNLGGGQSEFVFTNSVVSGFPFMYRVDISEPRFLIDDRDLLLEIDSEDNLTIQSNIIGTNYNITLPKNFSITGIDHTEELPWIITYNDRPTIDIKTSYKNLFSWLINGAHGQFSNVLSVNKITYSDQGCYITNKNNNTNVMSADKVELTYHYETSEQNDVQNVIETNIAGAILDNLLPPQKNAKLGKFDLQTDFTYSKEATNSNFNINKFHLQSDSFVVDASGKLNESDNSPLPFGNMQLKLNNYANFVDFKIALINSIVKGSAFPIFTIKQSQSHGVKQLLKKIASEKYNEDQDILLLLNRQKDGDLHVGTLGTSELLKLFKDTFKG